MVYFLSLDDFYFALGSLLILLKLIQNSILNQVLLFTLIFLGLVWFS